MQENTTAQTHTIVKPDSELVETPKHHSEHRESPFKKLPDAFQQFFQRFKRNKKTPETAVKTGNFFSRHKKLVIGFGIFFLVVAIIGTIAGIIGYKTYTVAMNLKQQAQEAMVIGTTMKEQLKSQNLPATEASLTDLQNRVESMKTEYQKLAFLSTLPIAKNYYQDGIHGFNAAEAGVRAGLKTVDAVVPYADVLGFAGEGTFTGGTAENRISLLIETLSKISPVLDDITAEMQTVQSELGAIDPNRYPEEFQGTAIRSQIINGQSLVDGAVTAFTEFRPAIEVLPDMAGAETRKKYLLIFQNDNELRPTGGFMTAYAVLFVEKGKVTPEKSDDIYELDKKFTKRIPIPEPLGNYLTTEKYFNLRDMNISPDFKVSMDTFYEHYQEVRGEPQDIDGIISIDTNVLAKLVEILGPIDVPGYGVFSAEIDKRCDCPQIIYALSEIVDRPTPYLREDRKGIIAPMMQAILQKSYSAPKEQWPALFQLAWGTMQAKHVQFYLFDETAQQAAEKINAAGLMNPPQEGHDYLAVVDANLGGAKSNLFVEQEAKLEAPTPENGSLTHKLTLRYKNDRAGDNCNLEAGKLCLNGTLRDWVRIYLPAGSEMVSTNGFDEGTVAQREELGFTVIEGVFRLAPLSNATVLVEYMTPYSDEQTYRLDLRKQAGTDAWKYLIDVNGGEEEVTLDKDKTVTVNF